jgi:hypothetical protein
LTIIVGSGASEKRFSVHESFICARSEFFRRAMNGNWAESEERLVKLSEDDPEIFAIYINHVYTNNIATNSCEGSKAGDLIRHELLMLSNLYILCENLCDKAGKNAMVEAIEL